MKPGDYETMHQPSKREFAPWTAPAKRYRIACCDCGLVHDMRFRLVIGPHKKRLDLRGARIEFCVRRNDNETAALRQREGLRTPGYRYSRRSVQPITGS